MPEFIRLILVVFSIYRLSSLIASEEGPYLPFLYKSDNQDGVFKWIRMKAGAYNYGFDGKPETNLGRGISCPLCVGAYVSVIVVVLMYTQTLVSSFFILWLGIWGVQTFLENLTSDDAIKEAIEDVADNMED